VGLELPLQGYANLLQPLGVWVDITALAILTTQELVVAAQVLFMVQAEVGQLT
jgi:hypothetical protein